MKVGDLVKHITSSKYGIIIEIMDYTMHPPAGVYCHILWADEKEPFWIWDVIIRQHPQ